MGVAEQGGVRRNQLGSLGIAGGAERALRVRRSLLMRRGLWTIRRRAAGPCGLAPGHSGTCKSAISVRGPRSMAGTRLAGPEVFNGPYRNDLF